jgi:beta-glucanase (GH16 family)
VAWPLAAAISLEARESEELVVALDRHGQSKTSDYTSGKVQGDGKMSFQYGKIEARLKMPRGAGTWPAFWLLGGYIHDVGWPSA